MAVILPFGVVEKHVPRRHRPSSLEQLEQMRHADALVTEWRREWRRRAEQNLCLTCITLYVAGYMYPSLYIAACGVAAVLCGWFVHAWGERLPPHFLEARYRARIAKSATEGGYQ